MDGVIPEGEWSEAVWSDWANGWILTGVDTSLILSRSMFSPRERQQIELKALEQALREAGLAHTDPDSLLPPPETWPFRLTAEDYVFLRINKISAE